MVVLCRDFQRGSCRYGSRCKFSHQLQGRQNQNQNQAIQAHQNQNQVIQAQDHRCNDPRACKERIKDDYANERPTHWRLTSYAHWKHLPNDIAGDTSFEELRAMAYESAQQGMQLAQIASREALMFRSKEAEFDALRSNPYKGPAASRAFSSAFNQPSTANTIFGKLVPNNSPISQMFNPETNTGGFGTGPVIQFQQPGFNLPQTFPFPAQSPVPQFPQNPSPFLGQQQSPFNPTPPLTNSFPNAFNQPSPPNPQFFPSANIQMPFPQATAPAIPMSSEETAKWSVEQWELGQIPEDEPPLAVR